jgi:3-methyladenine DNA glycosylase/8-oxoguanine DNA glycosylase
MSGLYELPSRKPFDLELTVRVLQRRSTNLVDIWDEASRSYRRMLVTRSGLVPIELTTDLRLATKPIEEIARTLDRMLGLSLDPAPFQRILEAEPKLRELAVRLRGMRPPRYPDLFETFVNVIPFLQLSVESGMAIVGRLVRRFSTDPVIPSPSVIAATPLAALEQCGLSASKARALREAAQIIESGELTSSEIEALPTALALERLTRLRGIGPWSAALILLRGFRRLDVFPPSDSGAEGTLLALLRLRSKASLYRFIDRFGDLRGYLYFCALASRFSRSATA